MIVCRQCGHEGREGTDFCESCGAFLEWEGERLDEGRASRPGPPPASAGGAGADAGERDRGSSAGAAAGPPAGAGPSGTAGAPPAGTVGAPPGAQTSGTAGGPAGAPPTGAPSPGAPPAGAPPAGASATTGGAGADMVICLECGGRNAADRRFCRRCGATLDLVALSGRSPRPRTEPPPAPRIAGPGGDPLTGPADDAAGLAEPGGVTAGGLVARPPAAPVPAPPRVGARPPAPVPAVAPTPSRGVQPAEPRPRPAPARPRRTDVEVPSGGPACPECGAANPPGRRFCRRCGASLPAAAAAPDVPGPTAHRRSWWRRLVDRLRGRGGEEEATGGRSARAAYRRSLDVRFRVLRILGALAGLGLLAGGLGLVGLNPISGARSLWDRFFPRYERVGELRATVQPEGTIEADFPPGAAVDGDPSTAWATTWLLEPDAPAPEPCATASDDDADDAADEGGAAGDLQGGAAASLVMTLPEAVEVAKISVQPGLEAGDPARAAQLRPTLLEVRFDDGTCTPVELDDSAGIQDHRLDGPQTTTVRITVVDAAPPTDPAASRGLVSIGEVRVFQPG